MISADRSSLIKLMIKAQAPKYSKRDGTEEIHLWRQRPQSSCVYHVILIWVPMWMAGLLMLLSL